MKPPFLYLIATEVADAEMPFIEAIEASLRGGVAMVQMRSKTGTQEQRIEQGLLLRELTRAARIPLIVNDDPHLAVRIQADGVHVGQDDASVASVRKIHNGQVGLSTHSVSQVRCGITAGADLLGVGPIFATETKDAGEPVGLSLMRKARALSGDKCLVGIGGINADNAGSVVAGGANGVAVCSAILSSDEPERAARELVDSLLFRRT